MFAYFDGDNVGSGLELLLLDDRMEDARAYSESIDRALKKMRDFLLSHPDVDVLLAGGDDLMAQSDHGFLGLDLVEDACMVFERECGCTISVGVGPTPSNAAQNLRRAKLQGKARVVASTGSV